MNKFFTTLSLLLATITFTSCELKNTINMDQIFLSSVYGKWNISSNHGYSSIEFTTEGYYFIEESDSENSVIWGKYTKSGDYQITLNDFGVIDITKYGDDYLFFDLTKDGSTEAITQYTSLDGEVDDTYSDQTDLLCTIWKVGDYTYTYSTNSLSDILPIQDRETDIAYVYFSTSDTFIVIDTVGVATSHEWVWKNTLETEINVTSNIGWSLDGVTDFEVDELSNDQLSLIFDATITVETMQVYITKDGEETQIVDMTVEDMIEKELIGEGDETFTKPFTLNMSRTSTITIETPSVGNETVVTPSDEEE